MPPHCAPGVSMETAGTVPPRSPLPGTHGNRSKHSVEAKKNKKKKGEKNYSNGSQTASVEGDSAPNPRLGALLVERRGEVTGGDGRDVGMGSLGNERAHPAGERSHLDFNPIPGNLEALSHAGMSRRVAAAGEKGKRGVKRGKKKGVNIDFLDFRSGQGKPGTFLKFGSGGMSSCERVPPHPARSQARCQC